MRKLLLPFFMFFGVYCYPIGASCYFPEAMVNMFLADIIIDDWGNIYLAGTKCGIEYGKKDFILMKMSADSETIWTYINKGEEEFRPSENTCYAFIRNEYDQLSYLGGEFNWSVDNHPQINFGIISVDESNLDTKWEVIDDSHSGRAYDIDFMDEDRIIAVGSLGKSSYVAAFDKNGEKLWKDNFNDNPTDNLKFRYCSEAYDVRATPDGFALVTGDTDFKGQNGMPQTKTYVRKYSIDGDLQWDYQYYYGPQEEYISYYNRPYANAIDIEGNMIIAGVTKIYDQNWQYYPATVIFTAKIDPNGKEKWENTVYLDGYHYTPGFIWVDKIATDENNNVYLAWEANGDPFLEKYDANGNKIFSKNLKKVLGDEKYYLVDFSNMMADEDNNLYLLAFYDKGNDSIKDDGLLLVKLNQDANIIWTENYKSNNNSNWPLSDSRYIRKKENYIYISAECRNYDYSDIYCFFIAKYDIDGNYIWSKIINRENDINDDDDYYDDDYYYDDDEQQNDDDDQQNKKPDIVEPQNKNDDSCGCSSISTGDPAGMLTATMLLLAFFALAFERIRRRK